MRASFSQLKGRGGVRARAGRVAWLDPGGSRLAPQRGQRSVLKVPGKVHELLSARADKAGIGKSLLRGGRAVVVHGEAQTAGAAKEGVVWAVGPLRPSASRRTQRAAAPVHAPQHGRLRLALWVGG